jgi:hypothetical protein
MVNLKQTYYSVCVLEVHDTQGEIPKAGGGVFEKDVDSRSPHQMWSQPVGMGGCLFLIGVKHPMVTGSIPRLQV